MFYQGRVIPWEASPFLKEKRRKYWGCLEGTCGALVGAGLVLGAVSKDRTEAMKRMKVVVTGFHSKNGATVCKHLKGIETGQPLRSCPGCVEDAAELLGDVLC